jgi:hypothetical protein
MIGAIVGGFAGAIVFTPVFVIPVIAQVAGACVGCFIGAALAELSLGRDVRHSARVGVGAAKGRFLGIAAKTGFGVVMLVVTMWSGVPVPGRTLAPAPGGGGITPPPATTRPGPPLGSNDNADRRERDFRAHARVDHDVDGDSQPGLDDDRWLDVEGIERVHGERMITGGPRPGFDLPHFAGAIVDVDGANAAVNGVEQQVYGLELKPLIADEQRHGDWEVHPVVRAQAVKRHAPPEPCDSRRAVILDLSDRPMCPISML